MNWSALLSTAFKPRDNRGRVLLWGCLLSLIFGSLALGEPLEDYLRDLRFYANQRSVKGDVTLVAIDNKSIEKVGRFPWPRARHAELADSLAAIGANRVLFDMIFDTRTDQANDEALGRSLERLGRKAVVPMVVSVDAVTEERNYGVPLPEFRLHTDLAHISVQYGMFSTVRNIPGSKVIGSRTVPSLAEKIAGTPATGEDPIDFSMTPKSVPVVSAIDVIEGSADPKLIRGKDVIIGITYTPLDDAYVAPVYNRIPGVYFHILGAETLKAGPPRRLPWLFSFLPALAVVSACTFIRRRLFSAIAIPLSAAAYLTIPILLERKLIFIEIVPALFLLLLVGSALSWIALRQLYRARGTTNSVSGLPNLAALQQRRDVRDRALVAARVHNYAAIASALPPEAERVLIEQIAKRLTVAIAEPTIYQGDEGIFAWLVEQAPANAIGSHLDALHRLFRSPIVVSGKQFDLRITFGFDGNADRSVANRLGSALVAADEAEADGHKWKEYDSSKLQDADWKLSLLGQLDRAIDSGDFWVAYQPKFDLRTSRIVGAEALARWTHPQKGPITPMEFILAAEENDRIDKLTFFVLEHAVRAAATINKHGYAFSISVNLSARLIDDPELVPAVTEVLARHGLAPSCLTLEVTETAAIGSNARHLETLQQLRDLGVEISVDDYGTGMSTLDYLQRIPATEIKIDRSFVAGMQASQGTKVMVNSTIQLAHSLGQKVVAEGVEDEETLAELRRMNCDFVQGYLIGRPVTFRALSKRMRIDSERARADG